MEEKLATELLHEIKAQSKRWFIAFVITLVLWFLTIGVFIWYITLPVEEYSISYDQCAENNSRNQIIGGDYNGIETYSEQEVHQKSNTFKKKKVNKLKMHFN